MIYSTEEEYKDGEPKPTGYYDFILTHQEAHVSLPRKPLTMIRKMEKSVQNRKPGKVMGKEIKPLGNNIIEVSFPLVSEAELERLKKKAGSGGKFLRIWAPKEGLFVYPGQDTIDFINANPDSVIE